ncbi:MAG: sigma-70 family RNA polymerase sigma factor [Eubacteriales bacterium]|nr:sigma-70 family RNA polymerase sigma factor [Eubacteriales bacterium]
MDEFEKLLCENRSVLERFVKFRLPSSFDADDVLQEIYMAANAKFATLNDKSCFKAWIIGIARNKCNDYYRRRAKAMEIPIDEVSESSLSYGRTGVTETNFVRETISTLASRDQEILYMYYFRDMSQVEIAKKLGIPLGTIKSRLHTAKLNFKEKYPYPPKPKGVNIMKKLPEMMPEYSIVKSDKEPFSVVWEELWGLFIVPRVGEKLSWGAYGTDTRKYTEGGCMEVICPAEVHGVTGVQIKEIRNDSSENQRIFHYTAQLTDTHCRMLAEEYERDGVHKLLTFLDEDDFLHEWGYGENNCGKPTHLSNGCEIIDKSGELTAKNTDQIVDIVGRFTVTIGGKSYDTVRVISLDSYYGEYTMSEQYLDKCGRTILWRRFNRDDWAFDRYKQKWSEKLPDNERLIVNGETYVHWYDCITDYIL